MTVNEMIIEALTTDSRKRKARYQTELEAIGYRIIKDGSWIIRNPKTNRFVEKEYSHDGIRSSRGYIGYGQVWSRTKHKYVKKPISVINFVGLLNEAEKEYNYFENVNSTSVLKDTLRDRKYHKNKLDSALSEYQSKIDAITQEYQRKLKNAEDSYRWSVKYHAEAFNNAETKIKKILRKGIDN